MKKEKNTIGGKKSLMIFTVLFVSLLFSNFLLSQEINNFETIKPTEQKNTSSGSSDLYALYYDNQPTIVIDKDKSFNSNSELSNRVVEISVSDLSLLSEKDYDLTSIELIRVIYNKSDEIAELDLSKISNLANLRAIVFQCDFKCDPKQIENLISTKSKSIIPIYYLVSIPQ
jgi:hypothetical protein